MATIIYYSPVSDCILPLLYEYYYCTGVMYLTNCSVVDNYGTVVKQTASITTTAVVLLLCYYTAVGAYS